MTSHSAGAAHVSAFLALLALPMSVAGQVSGYPTPEEYAASAGLDDVPDIDYYIAFSMFRLAAILAGVLKRGVTGNAADPRAVERGQTFKQVASQGWKILQKLQ